MRIKSFNDADLVKLESLVNEWLSENPDVDVVQLAQTESATATTITLLYREPQSDHREAMAMFESEDLLDEPVMEFPESERVATPA